MRLTLNGVALGGRPRLPDLQKYFRNLAYRLSNVRVLNGDWRRCLTTAVTTRVGTITGVFLDPPYTAEANRANDLYAVDDLTVGHEVRRWAVEHGDDPSFRIALCGFEGEYKLPKRWTQIAWTSRGSSKQNQGRERIWFSPYCLKTRQAIRSA